MPTKVSCTREGLPISKKHVHEIAESIKGKNVEKAIKYLERVRLKQDFVPFIKYPSKGHKHGIPAGYPKKASLQIIRMLKEMQANAKYMGFEVSGLKVSGYELGRGAYPRYGGGKVYRRGKRTNITIYTVIDQERKKVEKKEEQKKEDEAQEKEQNPKTPEKGIKAGEVSKETGEKTDAAKKDN